MSKYELLRKLVCGLLVLLMIYTAALAESVTQMDYELVIDGESRIGKYTGELLFGHPDGYGIFTTTNPRGYSWHYIGEWKAGLMHGEGAIYWEDGALEIGTYEDGHFVFGYCNYDGSELSLYIADSYERYLDSQGEAESSATPTEPVVMYIGNRNSHVFHFPYCSSVYDMKEKNKVEFYSREEAEEMDYRPCQVCNP